jgi:hypothetical protein
MAFNLLDYSIIIFFKKGGRYVTYEKKPKYSIFQSFFG